MDYNANHDLQLSYEMFYKKYVQKYGRKRNDEMILEANEVSVNELKANELTNLKEFINWLNTYNDPHMSEYSAFHIVRLYYALTEKVVSEEFVKANMSL